MLAERHAITFDEAFDRMRTHARSHRVKLHDVAVEIITAALDL